jgi:SAM-dependent methyltransferase
MTRRRNDNEQIEVIAAATGFATKETLLKFVCVARRWLGALYFILMAAGATAVQAADDFKPVVGQEGKDVVWVPTPPALVDKMLDMAKVTPQDFVIDLGSGDGRNVIAAAKRGARALGVEYNPDMVEYSKRSAAAAGVGQRANFVQGDMYEADISQATVLALFLLPENLNRLVSKFLDLKPGTRIVANHFGIDGWEADEVGRAEADCEMWCTALLYIVPAKVAGTWHLKDGELRLEQKFQTVSGTLTAGGTTLPVRNAQLRADELSFSAGTIDYTARVSGNTMQGHATGGMHGAWSATRGRIAANEETRPTRQ